MSAPAMRPSPAQARILAELARRVDQLEKDLKALELTNHDLRIQRDAARMTVAEQQAEYSNLRPRQLHHARPVVRDVPTGEAL